jgi:hypothetical protein
MGALDGEEGSIPDQGLEAEEASLEGVPELEYSKYPGRIRETPAAKRRNEIVRGGSRSAKEAPGRRSGGRRLDDLQLQ